MLRSGGGRVPKPLGAAPSAPVCGVLWGYSWVSRMPNRAHNSSNISNCSFVGTARTVPCLSFSPFLHSPALHPTLVSPFRARPRGLTSTVLGKPATLGFPVTPFSFLRSIWRSCLSTSSPSGSNPLRPARSYLPPVPGKALDTQRVLSKCLSNGWMDGWIWGPKPHCMHWSTGSLPSGSLPIPRSPPPPQPPPPQTVSLPSVPVSTRP